MKNKALKIIFTLVFIILIIFSYTSGTLNSISAAINESYSSSTGGGGSDTNLDKKINDNPVTGALASFVYSIASLIENLVGKLFKSVSGDSDFPWADRIIFNAVPLLDINFFNASENSFFKRDNQDTPVARMVRNTYFTVLAITIAFLTIVIAIAAIKMAISSLASEKAKYKEAITKWLFSITLIFLMHNLMSFIFFVNEGLVEVASGILLKNTDSFSDEQMKAIKNNLQGQLSDEQRVKNFINQNDFEIFGDEKKQAEDFILANEGNTNMAAHLLKNSDFRDIVLKYATDDTLKDSAFVNAVSYISDSIIGGNNILGPGIAFMVPSVKSMIREEERDPLPVLATTIQIAQDDNKLQANTSYWYQYKGLSETEVKDKFKQDQGLSGIVGLFVNKNEAIEFVKYFITITEAAEDLRNNFRYDNDLGQWVKNSTYSKGADILKTMASIFKEAAYTYPTDDMGNVTGWSPSKISVTGALLYSIFVFQSILYLFSYTKRFFYIIILAIFAPIIVLFDFLGKALT